MKNGIILSAVMAALCASGETVKTATQPWVRSYVATNRTDVSGKADATNVYTKAETDAKIVELAPAPGDYANVSNRAMTAIQEQQLGAFASTGAVARATAYGTATRWTDATGCVWEVTPGWRVYTNGVVAAGWTAWNYDLDATADGIFWALIIGLDEDAGSLAYTIANQMLPSGTTPQWDSELTIVYNSEADYHGLTDGDAIRAVRGETNLVGRVALTNDIPDMGAVQEEIADLRTESSLVYRLYSGSNVVAEVTNYNSQVHAPSLRLLQLNESNEYVTVWTETNGLARTLLAATNYADNAISERAAPRAWSRTTSGLGLEAPDGMTWVSTSNLVRAGGLEYEKHVTSGGAIWLLESNGMTADFHASNNNTAYLDISAADGTSIFRIEKTDSFLVGVTVNNVTVDGNTLVCGVNVVATEHPLVRVKARLTDASWAKEEDGIPASLATVAWSGTAGNWTCRITNNTGGNSLFAQMEYLQEGGTKIVNTAPLDVTPGILCTDGVHKVRPVYNNGNITWEVVQ